MNTDIAVYLIVLSDRKQSNIDERKERYTSTFNSAKSSNAIEKTKIKIGALKWKILNNKESGSCITKVKGHKNGKMSFQRFPLIHDALPKKNQDDSKIQIESWIILKIITDIFSVG